MIRTQESFKITYVDPSSLCSFTRCPAKYMFSRLMGLHNAQEKMVAADFGTCIHAALPYCYDMDSLPEGIEIFQEQWRDMGHGEDDKKRNTGRGIEMLHDFAITHSQGRCPYDVHSFGEILVPDGVEKISKNEIPFLIDIGGPLPLAGRIDLGIRWHTDGKLWPCDYKTASEISQRLFDSFWNSPQALAYTIAFGHLIGETPPGLMYEVIRTSTKNNETQLDPCYCHDHQLEWFLEWANFAATSILACNEQGMWPQHPTGCGSQAMFGVPTTRCGYQMLCDQRDWTTVVSLYDRREPWHPFKIKVKGEADETGNETRDGIEA